MVKKRKEWTYGIRTSKSENLNAIGSWKINRTEKSKERNGGVTRNKVIHQWDKLIALQYFVCGDKTHFNCSQTDYTVRM